MISKRLGEICNIMSGGTPARSNPEFWNNGTIPWLKIGDINNKYVCKADEYITKAGLDHSSAKIFSKGTILYTIFATLGEAGILNFDAATNQAIAGITINDHNEVLTDYLYYYLKSKKKFVNGIGRGVAQNNINMSMLSDFEVPLPGIDKQKEIVAIIDKVSDIITTRKDELQKLDDLIKARFVEMFGDIIINDKNWPTDTIDNISTSRLGKMLDAKQQTGDYTFPYLANFNVQWFHFDLGKLNKMDFDEVDQKEFALQEGDLLVTEGGEVGRCAVWHEEIKPCFYQKALHRIRCNREVIIPEYLAWWFKIHADYNQFKDIIGTTSIAHLPGIKLKKLNVAIPPMGLQKEFVAFVHQVDKSKAAVQKSLDETQLLFNSLMQKYFG